MTRLKKAWQPSKDGGALATELHTQLQVSHRQAKGVIDAGCVKVNGEVVHLYGHRLKSGDHLTVDYDPDTVYQTMPQPRKQLEKAGFKILWEDKHLLFVDKPAGLLSVPSEKGHEPSLAEAITDHYRRRGFKRFQLFIVHRLDRFTSGVLVFAKTPEALHGLKNIFEAHQLHRVYKAVLVGEIEENAGTLTGKLVEHAKSLKMSVVQPRKDEPKGAKHAITHFRVLDRLPGYTVVEVRLETGRRNQIRVQFADRGFPLLGDQVYGETSELIDRQALHAELLGFRHPVTDESVTVSAPMPPDMEFALKKLRTIRRVERAEAGIQGEEGIYKPKITKGRKFERVRRAERFGPERDSREQKTETPKKPIRRGRDSYAHRSERSERPERGGRREGAPKRPGTASGVRSRSAGQEDRRRFSKPKAQGGRPGTAGPRTKKPR
jgi:23S rRNA pseudouridine1911/1915/1917 synthase